MRKILFVLTSHDQKGDTGKPTGFHLAEMTHPHKILREAGYAIDFVSPKGGAAPIDSKNMDDPVNREFMETEAYVTQIKTTARPEQVDANHYAAIYFPGGHGAMWDLPDNIKLADMTRYIYESGGIVAAICHGPAALVNVRLSNGEYLVAGKEISSFTDAEEKAVGLESVVPFLLESTLKERGARHTKAPNFQKHVVIDDRLVTGQNPASADGVGDAVLSLLHKMSVYRNTRKAV